MATKASYVWKPFAFSDKRAKILAVGAHGLVGQWGPLWHWPAWWPPQYAHGPHVVKG